MYSSVVLGDASCPRTGLKFRLFCPLSRVTVRECSRGITLHVGYVYLVAAADFMVDQNMCDHRSLNRYAPSCSPKKKGHEGFEECTEVTRICGLHLLIVLFSKKNKGEAQVTSRKSRERILPRINVRRCRLSPDSSAAVGGVHSKAVSRRNNQEHIGILKWNSALKRMRPYLPEK